MVFTRPDYFSPVPFENLSMSTSNGLANNEWMLTDPALNLRACADPLLVGEDFFFSMCSLDSMCTVVYEPLDAHDKHRNTAQQQQKIKARGGRRRIWLQTILNDVSPDVVASNGGRLVVNGDKINRLRPGDSAYVRKLAPSETLTLYNCGRNPIEFIIAETPY
ncbi:hypothetical protein GGI12_006275 [Dipsacomyces acuminosporus]|nr:hypothetical protein GGI12_006275 [Dipsacomyces acuminosporus]